MSLISEYLNFITSGKYSKFLKSSVKRISLIMDEIARPGLCVDGRGYSACGIQSN